jgi:hypothetical protein
MPRMGTVCPLGIRHHPLVGTTYHKVTSMNPEIVRFTLILDQNLLDDHLSNCNKLGSNK